MTKKRDRSRRPEPGGALEEEGLRIEGDRLISPDGEFPLDEVLAVEKQVSKPMLLGAGLWFWLRGARHVLAVQTAAGEKRIWFTRDEQACRRACEAVQERISSLRLRA